MPKQLGINFENASEHLTDEEREVLRSLKAGRDKAQAVAAVAQFVGVTPRRLQEIVRHLINEHGEPIGSATSRPTGYYFINDAKEIEDVCQALRHRAICILHRVAKLKKSTVVTVFRQGEL